MRVLVVEDEWVIAEIVRGALETAGHVVLGPVANIPDALRLVQADLPFRDIAVLNIDLEGGGSGVDLAQKLFERWSIPSVFASGRAPDVAHDCTGALGYLTKPYRPSLVVRAVAYARDAWRGGNPGTPPEGFELYGR